MHAPGVRVLRDIVERFLHDSEEDLVADEVFRPTAHRSHVEIRAEQNREPRCQPPMVTLAGAVASGGMRLGWFVDVPLPT